MDYIAPVQKDKVFFEYCYFGQFGPCSYFTSSLAGLRNTKITHCGFRKRQQSRASVVKINQRRSYLHTKNGYQMIGSLDKPIIHQMRKWTFYQNSIYVI